jgi:putative addiction module component (TIGR02574 family)
MVGGSGGEAAGASQRRPPHLFAIGGSATMARIGGPNMSDRSASLLAAALQLPDADRAELVTGLLDSLDSSDGDAEEMSEDELVAELELRAEEMRRDPDAGVPWEQVRHMR